MKLAEFEINQNVGTPTDWGLRLSRLIARIDPGNVDGPNARVEIHSLDDKPTWSTERPKGWGVGWWCEVQRSPSNVYRGICVVDDSGEWVTAIVPSEASVWEFPSDQITAYGPRAEVGG